MYSTPTTEPCGVEFYNTLGICIGAPVCFIPRGNEELKLVSVECEFAVNVSFRYGFTCFRVLVIVCVGVFPLSLDVGLVVGEAGPVLVEELDISFAVVPRRFSKRGNVGDVEAHNQDSVAIHGVCEDISHLILVFPVLIVNAKDSVAGKRPGAVVIAGNSAVGLEVEIGLLSLLKIAQVIGIVPMAYDAGLGCGNGVACGRDLGAFLVAAD